VNGRPRSSGGAVDDEAVTEAEAQGGDRAERGPAQARRRHHFNNSPTAFALIPAAPGEDCANLFPIDFTHGCLFISVNRWRISTVFMILCSVMIPVIYVRCRHITWRGCPARACPGRGGRVSSLARLFFRYRCTSSRPVPQSRICHRLGTSRIVELCSLRITGCHARGQHSFLVRPIFWRRPVVAAGKCVPTPDDAQIHFTALHVTTAGIVGDTFVRTPPQEFPLVRFAP